MTLSSAVRRCAIIASVLMFTTAAAPAENWPQWRGPDNDGISGETHLPTQWNADNVAWKLKLPGIGGSTPAVWGDRLFLTSQDGDHVALLCVGTDGKELWRRPVGAGGGKIRPRRGQRRLGLAEHRRQARLRLRRQRRTGLLRLRRQGGLEVQRPGALRQVPDAMRHSLDAAARRRPALSAIVPLRRPPRRRPEQGQRQGNLEGCKAKSDGRDENEQSYASPVMWRNGKDAYLIVHGDDYAMAHRLTDGSEIWRVGGLNPKDHYRGDLRFVASPVATPGPDRRPLGQGPCGGRRQAGRDGPGRYGQPVRAMASAAAARRTCLRR